jgi:hypothetical protein
MSVVRAYEGGINDAQQFPRWLDDNLLHGATFRKLGPEHRPRVWINASHIYNRTPFVFSNETFSTICSDLASYPIANAVAASAAMPVILLPSCYKRFRIVVPVLAQNEIEPEIGSRVKIGMRVFVDPNGTLVRMVRPGRWKPFWTVHSYIAICKSECPDSEIGVSVRWS